MSQEIDLFSITTELLGLDRYEHIKFVNVFDSNWQLIQSYVHPNYLKFEDFSPQLQGIKPQSLPRTVSVTNQGLVALKTIGEEQFPIGYLLIVQDFNKPLNESKASCLGRLVFRSVVLDCVKPHLRVVLRQDRECGDRQEVNL